MAVLGRRPGKVYSLTCVLTLLIPQILASGSFSLSLRSYTNALGQGDNGNCCDSFSSTGTICDSNPCDQYMIICLDDGSGADDTNACSLTKIETDEVNDVNSFDFEQDSNNPHSGTFLEWPETLRVKVDVWDHDSMPFDSDDLVEELRHSFSIVPDNDRSEYHIQDVTVSGRTTLVMSITVACDQNYYGQSCTTYCSPPASGDNFECGSDGSKACHLGWTGSSCTQNVNECDSNPCQNGGSCTDQLAKFVCQCLQDYTGYICEIPREFTSASTPVATVMATEENVMTTILEKATTAPVEVEPTTESVLTTEGVLYTTEDVLYTTEDVFYTTEGVLYTTEDVPYTTEAVPYRPTTEADHTTLVDVALSSSQMPEDITTEVTNEQSSHQLKDVTQSVPIPPETDAYTEVINDELYSSLKPSIALPTSTEMRSSTQQKDSEATSSSIQLDSTSTVLYSQSSTVQKSDDKEPSTTPRVVPTKTSIHCSPSPDHVADNDVQPKLTFTRVIFYPKKNDVVRDLEFFLADKTNMRHEDLKLDIAWLTCVRNDNGEEVSILVFNISDTEIRPLFSVMKCLYKVGQTDIELNLDEKIYAGDTKCYSIPGQINLGESISGGGADTTDRRQTAYIAAIGTIGVAIVVLVVAMALILYKRKRNRGYEVTAVDFFPRVTAAPTEATNPLCNDIVPENDLINIIPMSECESREDVMH